MKASECFLLRPLPVIVRSRCMRVEIESPPPGAKVVPLHRPTPDRTASLDIRFGRATSSDTVRSSIRVMLIRVYDKAERMQSCRSFAVAIWCRFFGNRT